MQKSIRNLKSWPKGVSGNPTGRRPVLSDFRDAMRHAVVGRLDRLEGFLDGKYGPEMELVALKFAAEMGFGRAIPMDTSDNPTGIGGVQADSVAALRELLAVLKALGPAAPEVLALARAAMQAPTPAIGDAETVDATPVK
jgi:hypothetical protein